MSVEVLDWKRPSHPREPAAGYASRLAALNKMALAELLHACGLPEREIRNGSDQGVRAVATLGGLTRPEAIDLRRHTPRRDGHRTYAGMDDERLTLRAAPADFFRYCPRCIAEDLTDGPADIRVAARPWLRLEWLVAQVRSCHRHGIFLSEIERVGKRAAVDFSMAVAEQVLPHLDRSCSEAEVSLPNAFEEWVIRRLDGVRDPGNWLDSMPFQAAVHACEGLGIEAQRAETRGDARLKLPRIGHAEWAAASSAGYRIATGGEAGITAFLSRLVTESNASGYIGLKSTYGYINTVLARTATNPESDRFRDIVRRHALDNIPLEAGTNVFGHVVEKRLVHTAFSAAAASGTTHPTLRTILARQGIVPARKGQGYRRVTVRASEFDDLLQQFGTALKPAQVVERTGMTHKNVLELIARGTIPTLLGSRGVLKARHRLAPTEVDAFMERLFEDAVTVAAPTTDQVPVGRACLVASTNVGDLVALVLSGKLAWKGSLNGSRRFRDLLVDAGEVRSHLTGSAPPRRGLLRKELDGEMPGMRVKVVGALIEAGRLEVAGEFCPASGRRMPVVTRESFEAFKARYVTITELCRVARMDAQLAKRLLDEAGHATAFDPSQVHTRIYERADVSGSPLPSRSSRTRRSPNPTGDGAGHCMGPHGVGA